MPENKTLLRLLPMKAATSTNEDEDRMLATREEVAESCAEREIAAAI